MSKARVAAFEAALVQYLSWVGTCPEFASEPAIPAPDHAGTAAEPAGTCPEFAPPAGRDQAGLDGVPQELVRT